MQASPVLTNFEGYKYWTAHFGRQSVLSPCSSKSTGLSSFDGHSGRPESRNAAVAGCTPLCVRCKVLPCAQAPQSGARTPPHRPRRTTRTITGLNPPSPAGPLPAPAPRGPCDSVGRLLVRAPLSRAELLQGVHTCRTVTTELKHSPPAEVRSQQYNSCSERCCPRF